MLKYGRSTAVVSALADSLASAAPSVDLVTWCPASRVADESEVSTSPNCWRGRRPPHRCAGAVDPDPYRPHAADHPPSRRAPRRSIVAVARSAPIGAVGLADRRCHHHGGDAHGGRTAASVRRCAGCSWLGRHALGGVRRAPRERRCTVGCTTDPRRFSWTSPSAHGT